MIKKIEVNGEQIPVNYGMNALAMYSELREVSMDEAINLNVKTMNLMDYMTLLYVGVTDGARVTKEECKFKTIEEFMDYADEYKDTIPKVLEVFAAYGKEAKEGSKKK